MIDNKYTLETMFTFDSIVDIDLAYIKYFKKYLSNMDYMDRDILSSNDIEFFKAISISRKERNIIELLLRDPYKDSAYDIKEEIETTDYNRVLDRAEPTSLYDLVFKASSTNFIKCTVMCRNEHEKLYIKTLLPENVKYIKPNMFNEQHYGAMYVKDILDINSPEKMDKRTLYVLSYAFNMQNYDNATNTIKEEYVEKFPPSSKIYLVSPYKEFKLPK